MFPMILTKLIVPWGKGRFNKIRQLCRGYGVFICKYFITAQFLVTVVYQTIKYTYLAFLKTYYHIFDLNIEQKNIKLFYKNLTIT
jgi:hypothetical protein